MGPSMGFTSLPSLQQAITADIRLTRNRLPNDLVAPCQTIVGVEGRIWTLSLSPHDWCQTLLTLHECPKLEHSLDLVHGLRRPRYRQSVMAVVRCGLLQRVITDLHSEDGVPTKATRYSRNY